MGKLARSYYHIKQAYSPIHVMSLFDKWNPGDDGMTVEFYAVNDTLDTLEGNISYSFFNSLLECTDQWETEAIIPWEESIKLKSQVYKNSSVGDDIFFILIEIRKKALLLTETGTASILKDAPKNSGTGKGLRCMLNHVIKKNAFA